MKEIRKMYDDELINRVHEISTIIRDKYNDNESCEILRELINRYEYANLDIEELNSRLPKSGKEDNDDWRND